MFLNSIEKRSHYLVQNSKENRAHYVPAKFSLLWRTEYNSNQYEKMLNSKIYHLLFKDISLGLNSNFYCLRRISHVF